MKKYCFGSKVLTCQQLILAPCEIVKLEARLRSAMIPPAIVDMSSATYIR